MFALSRFCGGLLKRVNHIALGRMFAKIRQAASVAWLAASSYWARWAASIAAAALGRGHALEFFKRLVHLGF